MKILVHIMLFGVFVFTINPEASMTVGERIILLAYCVACIVNIRSCENWKKAVLTHTSHKIRPAEFLVIMIVSGVLVPVFPIFNFFERYGIKYVTDPAYTSLNKDS